MAKGTRSVGNFGSAKKIKISKDESFVDLGIVKIYKFATAITTGVTAVPTGAATGDLAITTHATGGGSFFKNVGGVWTAT